MHESSENQDILLLPVTLVKQLLLIKSLQGWKLPAGKVTAGESIEKAAKRELQNTTGYIGTSLRHLGSIDVANNGYQLYMATRVEQAFHRPSTSYTNHLESRP